MTREATRSVQPLAMRPMSSAVKPLKAIINPSTKERDATTQSYRRKTVKNRIIVIKN